MGKHHRCAAANCPETATKRVRVAGTAGEAAQAGKAGDLLLCPRHAAPFALAAWGSQKPAKGGA